AHYSKIDLVSEIISEKTYTDLQGIMAGYYLKEAGFAKGICAAVSQQYLPAGENSALPETIEGAILSLSNKILLMAVSHFLNLPVTGSKDIYGVRRAALGFYKVLSEFDIHIDVSALLNRIDFLNEMQKKQVYSFIVERIRAFESEVHGISREIIDAAAYSPEPDLLMLKKKIYSLEEFSKNPAFSDTKTTLKRVLNILEKGRAFEFQEDFLIEDAEKQLFDEFLLFKEKVEGAGADFDRIWSAILDLKPEIDNFFDKVMVNVEDEKIKNNRKGLLALIGDMLLKIANFKIIS
ncbi:glycine--tRNA ligase subunit beta, partial [bacterium]|nr:glycine--tRNA ligase subunit beta [bacterium]